MPSFSPPRIDQVGALHPRLERAPDHHVGVRAGAGCAPRSRARRPRTAPHSRAGASRRHVRPRAAAPAITAAGRRARLLVPQRARAVRPGRSQRLGQRQVARDEPGQRQRRRARRLGQRREAGQPRRAGPRPSPAQAARSRASGKAGPLRRRSQLQPAGVQAGAARAPRRMRTSGCLSTVSSVAVVSRRASSVGHVPQQPPRRRQRQRPPGAVVGHDPPAVQRGRDPPRQHPVGRDQRRALPVLDRLAQPQRDRQRLGRGRGRLDQRQARRGRAQVAQRRPLAQPLVASPAPGAAPARPGGCAPHRARRPRPRRRTSAGAAPRRGSRRGRSGTADGPRPSSGRPAASHTAAGRSKSKPGSTTAPCGSARHRLHQRQRRPARAGRARHEHRVLRRRLPPALRQRHRRRPLARGGVGRALGGGRRTR